MAKKKLTVKDIDHITVRALAKKLKSIDRFVKEPKKLSSAEERRPQLAFFLGAGASFESGIMLAGQMMRIFKEEIFDTHCQELTTEKEKADWLKTQAWYKSGREEYGCLFEKVFETKTERQRFIEDVIADKSPSFGYVVLANLLSQNYINTVLTTNYDDLVYVATTTFTKNRPAVYSYGISVSEIKMLSSNSKILKLHGDYLYSNIANTGDEMLKQAQALTEPYKDIKEAISSLNMERQVRTVFDNFGVVVIGYSGGDKTVMELLDNVSKDNGFYWCYVKGYEPDEEVCNLVKSKNGKFIEIEGFDALMYEIYGVIKLDFFQSTSSDLLRNYRNLTLNSDKIYSTETKDVVDVISSDVQSKLTITLEPTPNEELSKTFKNNTLNTMFEFPEEMKIPCEQYLMYFVNFLKDFHITCNTRLSEEKGKVFFSVTPADKNEALSKIREALAIYLNLPSSPTTYDDSFASIRLELQIQTLQHSQKIAETELRLAEKFIQNQDDILSKKDYIIDEQRKIIEKVTSKSIMIDSLENKEELEEIIEGLKVGESKFLKEQFGVHLNPITLVKNLGKKLSGKQSEGLSIIDNGNNNS
jgi:NAD-dependent SIR2 family protein deacetylase